MHATVTDISTNVLGWLITTTTLTNYDLTSIIEVVLLDPSNSTVGPLLPLTTPMFNLLAITLPPPSPLLMTELSKHMQQRAHY